MRGKDKRGSGLFSYVDLEARVPAAAVGRALFGRRHADRGLGVDEELPPQGGQLGYPPPCSSSASLIFPPHTFY